MSSRVIPADNTGQGLSSQRIGKSEKAPVRSQSAVNETVLQIGVALRLLSKATKLFQGELEDLLEKCKDISYTSLETLFENEFNVSDLWQTVFGKKWMPTRKNKRVLCENILQNCMIYLHSERIGRPDQGNVLKTFGYLIALDLFEIIPIANIFIFFHFGEVTAGWILLGFLILERLLQVLTSIAFESISLSSILASLTGFKTYLNSYYIACHGMHAKLEGANLFLVGSRLFQKGINGIFSSTPQAVLNAYMVFSKLKAGEAITMTMRMQIFVVFVISFSVGASLTNLMQEADRNYATKEYYKSMTKILLKENDRFIAALFKGGWNICHQMIVTCALGAIIAKTSPLVWGSILVGFFLLLNVMRCVVNKGRIRYFLSVDSSWTSSFGSIVIPSIAYTFGVGLIPLSILRWHCILGPAVYGIGWISSFLISSITVLYFSSDLFLWIFFAILISIYIVFVILYLRCLTPKGRETFFWSKKNWSDILRTEWWENPHYESTEWNDIHLIGNEDANYAAMVNNFSSYYLPWDKLTLWLNDNKNHFKNNPPTWLSKEWLTLIPKQHRDEIWDNDEYDELLLRLERVEEEFRNSRSQGLLESEEVNDDNTLEVQNDTQGVIEEKNDDIPRTQPRNHANEVNDNENRNNPPTEESTSSEEETAVVVNEVIQEEQNELRQKVIENINK
eukprot:g541.t1